MKKIVISGLVACLIGLLPAPAVHAQGAIGAEVEYDIDRWGGDYQRLTLSSPEACYAACQADITRCQAYTFVKPGVQGPTGVCYLKNSVPPPRPNPSCISGRMSLTRRDNFDRFGADFRFVDVPTVEACSNECRGDPRCRAFTWHKTLHRCWLKEDSPRESANTSCISGSKGEFPDISIVAFNAMGYNADMGVPWRTRFTRLVDFLVSTNRAPDILAATEVDFYDHYGGGYSVTELHESTFTLLAYLRYKTGRNYRVAYAISTPSFCMNEACGPLWGRTYMQGQLILYDAGKLANIGPSVSPPAVAPLDYRVPGVNTLPIFRRSLGPCPKAGGPDNRAINASRRPLIGLFDGPVSTVDCPEAIPMAPVITWTDYSRAKPFPRRIGEVVYLGFPTMPGSVFPVFNVHLSFDGQPTGITRDTEMLQQNVTLLVQRFVNTFALADARKRFYPALIIGDLNVNPAELVSRAPGMLEEVMNTLPDVMGAVRVKRQSDPWALYDYRIIDRTLIGISDSLGQRDPNLIVGDHYAIYMKLMWMPPPSFGKISKKILVPGGTRTPEPR